MPGCNRPFSGTACLRWATVVVLVVAACATAAARVSAQQADATPQLHLAELRVGIEGRYKAGCWTAVELQFAGIAAEATAIAELTTADGDGVPVVYRSEPIKLLPGRRASTVVYARFTQSQPNLQVVLRSEGQRLLDVKVDTFGGDGPTLPLPLGPEDRLIVSVGRLSALDEVRYAGPNGNSIQPFIAGIPDPTQLPTRWYGYESVDCVVLSADALDFYSKFAADGPQAVALRRWVELGGKLLLSAGRDVESLCGPNGPLGRIVELKISGSTPLPRAAALEAAADGKSINLRFASDLAQVRVPRVDGSSGVVEVGEGDLPLVLRRPFGLGRVTIALVDLDHPLLQRWSGRGVLLRRMLDSKTAEEADSSPQVSGPYYGYGDLAGQLRGAVDEYDNVQVISFFTLAMLVIGYILAVGPGDYLLVRRVFKRTEATWITLPIIVMATTVGGYYLASRLKGDDLRTHQVDIIDYDLASGTVRGTSYAGIFSPNSRTYDIAWRPQAKLLPTTGTPEVLTSWLGLPGDGMGGMRNGNAAGSWFVNAYASSAEHDVLTGVPIQVWSSKLFQGRWDARTAPSSQTLAVDGNGRLQGKVQNPFGVRLRNVLIYHAGNPYLLGDLAVGESRELTPPLGRGVQDVLRSVEVVTSSKPGSNPTINVGNYDTGNRNVPSIVQKMMFYEAVGGRGYTNLDHRFQAFLDLSEHLRLGRAVLTATVDDPAAAGPLLELNSDGDTVPRPHDRREVFVRAVIPVQ